MRYLNRRGDIDETSKVESICIFRNWTETIPRFGFIVPTYKRADLLKYALNSILQQDSDVSFEVLVVDDNPERDDETERLMLSHYNHLGIAYYKNGQNLKQEGNWNKLFELSRTEWLIMLHDDDMLYPDYMKALLTCMSNYSALIGGFFPCFLPYKCDGDSLPRRESCCINARVIKVVDFLQGCILGAPLGMCVKRDLIIKLGGVNINSGVAVDYDFFNRLATVTDVVKMYDYPLGIWRIMDNVSQKVETPLFCIKWGDILKQDTLEYCGLNWLMPLYKHYVQAFDHQHILNWHREMGKMIMETTAIPACTLMDEVVYKVFRLFFSLNRHICRESCRITLDE